MEPSLFTPDFKTLPFWLEALSDFAVSTGELPAQTDVLVIGSGYTGLNAALQTARAGRYTVVIDAGDPGCGCSTRNGGQISTSVKPSVKRLAARVGMTRAKAIRREGEVALDWIESFVEQESIECSFSRSGRFHAAHTPRHFDALVKETKQLTDEGIDVEVVTRSDQFKELGTEAYHGGVVYTKHASLHPGNYYRGLLQRVCEAGASVVGHCRARSIEQSNATGVRRFVVKTDRGVIQSRELMIATNGYTGDLTPWLQHRVVPIGSYIIATEPLPESLVDELFPTNRIVSDTCRVVYYYRLAPDRTRVLFGGRVSATETDPRKSAPKLHQDLCRIFPQLQNFRISHSWAGTVAYTFDTLAHTGTHDGMYYAMGYCGSGVSMASYLGMRAGLKILGEKSGNTAFDDLPFPTRALYHGRPWFLPPVVSWYRWRDKLEYSSARRNNS